MRESSKYESIAAVLALTGAVTLVAVYFPILNPDVFEIQFHRKAMPIGWYISGTPMALAILVAAWRYDGKAAHLKNHESDRQHLDNSLD
jgi:hypothetical protein